jgi:DNA-binding NarL/FixJ family response regulator
LFSIYYSVISNYYLKNGKTIVDLIMPVLDGKKCLEEILRVNPNAKVVVASGYSDGGSSDGVMAAGAKGFVQKPYNMRQFLTTIREILDAD